MVTVTYAAYAVIVLAFAGERIVELVVSRRHARLLLARGGVEHGRAHYPAMVAIHAALLVGCLVEPIARSRPFVPALGLPMLALAAAAQALRWWSIRSLGVRWSTRVIVLPGAPRIARGPYRFFAHPNYVAVVVEGAALPLVYSAWITAFAFTLANALVLAVRIDVEEHALGLARPAMAAS